MTQVLVPPAELPSYGILIGDRQRRRLEAAGRFPRRVAVTEHKHAYVRGELLGFIASRVQARDEAAAA